MSSNPRLNRLLSADGKCFVVAMDHGNSNVLQLLRGIEHLGQQIAAVAAGNPDAILLNTGQAFMLQDTLGKEKPTLLLRADVTNMDIPAPHYFDVLIDDILPQALRLDAAAVVTNLFYVPELPLLYQQCLQNVLRLKAECERVGMPLMVEPRVLRRVGDEYQPGGDVDGTMPLVRLAFELGADLVKVDPSTDPMEFHRVVEVAGGKPVLPLGGGKVEDAELLARTRALLQQGAQGLVYGRNVFLHPTPTAMTRALVAIVHRDASPKNALAILHESQ